MSADSISQLVKRLEPLVLDSSQGLNQDLFLFVSRLTPLVNVDLLVQKQQPEGQSTLLTWRNDSFYAGWHIPGGIVRFKESFDYRIRQVAKLELSAEIQSIEGPVSINQKMNPERDVRGHFISLLFRVNLRNEPNQNFRCKNLENPETQCWEWFVKPPKNLLQQHKVYAQFF